MVATSTNIFWTEQNKIRIRETSETQQKHLVVKALVMLHLKIKHRRDSNWIRLYSEFPVVEGKICDIYYENIKLKEAVAYEIQSRITKQWENETKKAYENWEIYEIPKTDYIIIDLSKLSDNLDELSSQIKELIV